MADKGSFFLFIFSIFFYFKNSGDESGRHKRRTSVMVGGDTDLLRDCNNELAVKAQSYGGSG